jgi:hypothetical protein
MTSKQFSRYESVKRDLFCLYRHHRRYIVTIRTKLSPVNVTFIRKNRQTLDQIHYLEGAKIERRESGKRLKLRFFPGS